MLAQRSGDAKPGLSVLTVVDDLPTLVRLLDHGLLTIQHIAPPFLARLTRWVDIPLET